MAGTFASSLVAIESAKDTVISADGAFVDKKTGALISTENPHFTTKAAGQVQALGLLSSEVNGDNTPATAKLPPVPMAPTSNASIATTEVLVSPKGEMIAVAPLTNEKGSLLSASGQSVKTDAAKYFTRHDAEGIGAFLDADFEDLTSVLSFTVDYLAGATIVLPIASWERRFIGERRFIDTAQSDDADQGEGEVEGGGGSGGSADGFYGMMLMSSTHHRFAGLFTIRKPGAPPVTQLLVRGSDEETMAHLLMYSTNYTALAEALTTTKGMVGRRLLQCSDLSTCINFPWPVGRECIGFEWQCNSIVNGITATWSALVDAANAAKNLAIAAKEKAEKALKKSREGARRREER